CQRKVFGCFLIHLLLFIFESNQKPHLQAIFAKHPTANVYGIDEKTGMYFHNGILERMEGMGVYQMQDGICRKINSA
ncbi:hypothetical protein AB9M62_21205, partial [Bacillales bacterium AN1005]